MADFTGISFPFRIGVKGGVVMSSTNGKEIPHIIESIQQILQTAPYERCMEYHIYSEIDSDIFEPNDTSTHTLISYQVKEDLKRLENRIEVKEVQIQAKDNEIYATILFKVLAYDTAYSAYVKVGDINVQNSNTGY